MQEKGRALDKALQILSFRAHSEKELTQKLAQAGYDERQIAEAMEKLAEYRLIDDKAFAAQWAASRAKRGLGPRRVAQELLGKGISQEDRSAALSLISEESMLESAVSLAEKHLRREGVDAKRRAFDALNRRGFGYDIAKQAVERVLSTIDEE